LADSIDETNYRDENIVNNIDEGMILWSMTELYKAVGSYFAQRTYKRLKSEAGLMMTKAEEDVWYQEMINYVKRYAGQKIISITEYSRKQAITIIRQVIEESTTLGAVEIASLIKKSLISKGIEINKWRSLRIARTEVMIASNEGTDLGARATGLPMDKYWIPTYDKRTRDTHMAVASQNPIDINDSFEVGMYRMMKPGDSSLGAGAEEIINCRCTLAHNVKTIENIKL